MLTKSKNLILWNVSFSTFIVLFLFQDSQETVITISTMEIPTKNSVKKSADDPKEKNSW